MFWGGGGRGGGDAIWLGSLVCATSSPVTIALISLSGNADQQIGGSQTRYNYAKMNWSEPATNCINGSLTIDSRVLIFASLGWKNLVKLIRRGNLEPKSFSFSTYSGTKTDSSFVDNIERYTYVVHFLTVLWTSLNSAFQGFLQAFFIHHAVNITQNGRRLCTLNWH